MAFQRKVGRAFTVLTLVAASIWIIMVLVNFSRSDESKGNVQIGQPAPNFTLTALDGSKLSLSDLKGKAVLMNFWGSWCEPCRDEMPEIQRAYEKYKDQGLLVIGVNIGESKVTAKGFADRYGVSFPVVLDPDRKVTLDTYKVGPIPTSFFIDEKGIIRQVFTGPMTEETLEKNIQTVLPKP